MVPGATLSATTATGIAVPYNIGAIIGGTICGSLSQRFGRRITIIACAVLGRPLIPIFAFAGNGAGTLALGAFLMQVMVQGAWGVIPAHLTEMSPDAIRGFALMWTVIPVLIAATVRTAIGKEARASHSATSPP